MAGWLYLFAVLAGSCVTWVASIVCLVRRRWRWAATGLVPFLVAATWLFGVWTQLDWDATFLDQDSRLLAAQGMLLAIVWITAIGTWRACLMRDPDDGRGGAA